MRSYIHRVIDGHNCIFTTGTMMVSVGHYEDAFTASGHKTSMYIHTRDMEIVFDEETIPNMKIEFGRKSWRGEMVDLDRPTYLIVENSKFDIESKEVKYFTYNLKDYILLDFPNNYSYYNSWGVQLSANIEACFNDGTDVGRGYPLSGIDYLGNKNWGLSSWQLPEFAERCFYGHQSNYDYFHNISLEVVLANADKLEENGMLRYNQEVLQYYWRGENVPSITELTEPQKIELARYILLEKSRKITEEKEREKKEKEYQKILNKEGYWAAKKWAKQNNYAINF